MRIIEATDQLASLREDHRRREAAVIQSALTQAKGLWERTAELLGCGLSTLQRALERHPELAEMRRELRTSVTKVTPKRKPMRTSVENGQRDKRKTSP